MTTFDRIKVVFPARHIGIIKGFQTITEDDRIKNKSFLQKYPCYVSISVNYDTDKARIEFTSKVLKKRYDEKINYNNIAYCLEAIKSMGVCKLDVDSILEDAEVEKCDVTKDVAGIDLPDLKTHIGTHIANYNQWTLKPIKNNDNVILEKNVVTSRNKRRLSIYDKEDEMSKATNKDYLAWAGNEVKNSFKGITRFELSLTTCAAIRSVLKVTDTRLETVLNAEANPIADLLDSALRKDTCFTSTITTLSQFDKQTTLAYYNWDIEAIEKNARIIYKERYHKNKLEPYQRLIDAHAHNALSRPTPMTSKHYVRLTPMRSNVLPQLP